MDLVEAKRAVEADPGSELALPLAREAFKQGDLATVVHVCSRLLTARPAESEASIILAHVWYRWGAVPFAIRELHEARRQGGPRAAIEKLLALLEPTYQPEGSSVTASPRVIAEVDLDPGSFSPEPGK